MRDGKIIQKLNQRLSGRPYVLCACEGAAEKAVIDLLVDHGKLKFSRKDLVEGQVTRIRQVRDIEQEFLNRDYEARGLVICRILDSRNENFKLRKQYAAQYEVFNFYTRPEIEMLHILASGRYEDFKKSEEKPSVYFKKAEGWKNYQFKSEKCVKEMYADVNVLLHAIKEYDRICGQKGELNLLDLLTEEAASAIG